MMMMMKKLLVLSCGSSLARLCLFSPSSPSPSPASSSIFSRSIHVSKVRCISNNGKKEVLPLPLPNLIDEDDALHPNGNGNSNSNCYRNYIIPTVSATLECKGEIADELVEALMSFGASSVTITNGTVASSAQEGVSSGPVAWSDEKRKFWDQSKLTALFPAEQDVEESLSFAFESIGLKEMPPYEIEAVKHQDWEQEVKDLFQPSKISENLWIVPKWSTVPDPSAVNVILDPGLAFGTGDHPTTQLCLRWLKQVVKGGENVLDYGIGSGILAISALKLGASHAVGVDIDPIAVTSAKQNASLNGFGSESLEVVLAPSSSNNDEISISDGAYDIVIANLLLNPVLQLSCNLLRYLRPGGCLGLSGILESQVDQVLEAYAPYLENISVQSQDGWACVNGIKSVSHP